ncbi:MAG: hypothetical protein J6U54_03500 [Clostridiales bacterium]|nr:hypothetical protein [Clostridiales bacterium]
MLSSFREQIEALTKKNTELIASGIFSFGGMIAITLFALFLNILDKKNHHDTDKEELA